MLKFKKPSHSVTLLQMLAVLGFLLAMIVLYREPVWVFFQTTQAGLLGLVLNGAILFIFLIGLVRMVFLFLAYNREQEALHRFVKRTGEKVSNPTITLPDTALITRRYRAVQTIASQLAPVNQGALAATLAADQQAQFTLVRFVNSILILAGVLGTVVSLAVALMGAAGLMNSPDNMKNMWDIIGGMSNSLSTTVTAIVCYVFFAYFYLRLQDARTQLLANIEDVTSLYILPRFKYTEHNLLGDVALLTADLQKAAESLFQVQDRFLQVGDHLQLAVHSLQAVIAQNAGSIDDLHASVRQGFRLDGKEEAP